MSIEYLFASLFDLMNHMLMLGDITPFVEWEIEYLREKEKDLVVLWRIKYIHEEYLVIYFYLRKFLRY
jgi:hypothetical protein